MGSKTNIEWTDATWNPIRGCSRVSEGCRNCYAEKVAYRFSGKGQPYDGLVRFREVPIPGSEPVRYERVRKPEWNGQVRFVEEHLLDPLKWGPVVAHEGDCCGERSRGRRCCKCASRPRRIFVNSMSDLFHEDVPDEWIDRIFAVMALCPQHTFQILTKRPERMLKYCSDPWTQLRIDGCISALIEQRWHTFERMPAGFSWQGGPEDSHVEGDVAWPLPNVWLGVSVENQKAADERIPLLLQTPAAVRFISAEPLLNRIEVSGWLRPSFIVNTRDCEPMQNKTAELLSKMANAAYKQSGGALIDWVICGGESGSGAWPMHPDWARSLRDQCQAAGVPFFFKQWGDLAPGAQGAKYGNTKLATRIDRSGRDVTDLSGLWDASDALFYPVGKKAAGALLDGREWREFPSTGDAQ